MSEADTLYNQVLPKPSDLINTNVTDLTEAIGMTQPGQAEEADWMALAKKLRQHNHTLMQQVAQLEQALRECQEAFGSQQARSQAQERLLLQQTEELKTAQEQVNRLFRELESSHQAAQRQQILIKTLSQQLESSQERVAQIERECALTQQRNNEQSHQLLQTENVCRELHTRLQRQQRQTLQFKTALENCLETPAPSLEAKAEPSSTAQSQRHIKSLLAELSLLPKAQPIQPWSAQPKLLEESGDVDQGWSSQTPPEFPSPDTDATSPKKSPTNPSVLTDWEPLEEMPSDETCSAAGVHDQPDSMADISATEQELEQQLLADIPDIAWMLQLLDEPDEDLPSKASPDSAGNDGSEFYLNQGEQSTLPLQEAFPPNNTDEIDTEVHRQSADALEDFAAPEPLQRQEQILSQYNWPSPVLYPLRTSKKLKSLAAIELPSFPPYRHS